MVKFVSTLMQSRDQAHIFHLQTNSYAAHKALNSYYEDIVDLIDGLIESYQGKYGIIKGYVAAESYKESADVEEVVKYFSALAKFVERAQKELPKDTYIQNQIDEITQLINSTLYKLTFLM